MMKTASAPIQRDGFLRRFGRDLKRNKFVYFMWLPVMAYYILFHYIPMGGIVIAFQNYKPFKGIAKSQFVGLKWFVDFLTGPYAWRVIRNTLVISVYSVLFAFPAPILLALMINEVKRAPFKKAIQTVSYMPHFISLIVMCGLISDFSSSMGLFNAIGSLFGAPVTNYLSSTAHYRTLYVGSGVWKSMGWSSIIYLATLSGVDTQLYEAAYIDGANKFQRILHVTLPALVPIITVQFIMRIGHIMSLGYEKIILLYNSTIYETADVISTYLYRYGLLGARYGMGTAIGLMNSVINIIILVTVNKTFARLTENSLW